MTLAELWKRIVLLFCIGFSSQLLEAQPKPDGPDVYGARNTFGVMAEYSNDSSHIILGQSENIRLGAVGVQYQRRLFSTQYFVFSYAAEFRPVILQSIPKESVVNVQTQPVAITTSGGSGLVARCRAASFPYSFTFPVDPPVTYAGTAIISCGHETNYAQGLSPIGLRVNLRPGHRLQPTFSGFAGYILSTKPLPVANAGSFNFSFEVGAGLEYHLAPKRSVRVEYQLQHYSNDYTADTNPGVDSGMFKVSYSFGR